jgi:hypothetical protein
MEEDAKASGTPSALPPKGYGGITPDPPPTVAEPVKPTTFVGSVKLDGARVGRDAGRIGDEVIAHLAALPGATVDVTLEVHVRVGDGVDDDVVRTVSENASALNFDHASFEKD